MKNTVIGLVLAGVMSAGVLAQEKPQQQPAAATTAAKLSELELLKVENLKLRAENAQLKIDLMDREAKLASKVLTIDQLVLEQQLRKTLNCKPDDKFNWATLKCEANGKK